MFSIAVCDDERGALEQNRAMVQALLSAEEIPFTCDAYESSAALLAALSAGRETRYSLLLLDVVMDDMDGMALARELRRRETDAAIIFISSCPEFALMGYEVDAVRFLTKPVDPEKFREAVLCAHARSVRRTELLAHTDGGERRVPLGALDFAEISGRGVRLALTDGELSVTNSMGELEQELSGAGFIRCHQSYLVNLRHVQTIRRYELTLQDGRSVPVSKSRFDATRRTLIRHAAD